MARTVPGMITYFARRNAPFVYTLDIVPASGDSWLQKRYATQSVEIGGNAYDDALVDSISRIISSARVESGGAMAEFGDVTCRILNRNRLHESFNTDDPTERQAIIKMGVISPNVILNSTFGKYTGSDFEDWTETVGGGSFAADTTNKYDGACSLAITSGSPEPYITSNTFKIYQGTRLYISFWMRGANPGDDVILYFNIGGIWFNFTTRIFSVSRAACANSFAVSAAATWERKSCYIDFSEFTGAMPSSHYFDCYIQFESNGNNINIDAVQVEPTELTDYHHNRFELADDDMLSLYSGAIKQLKWDRRNIELQLQPWGLRHHREIPITILTLNTDATWEVPDESIGKPFPMTYGDFVISCGDFWDVDFYLNYNMAVGLIANIDKSATNGVQIYFDRPGMSMGAESAAAFWKNRLYHYDRKARRYIEQMYDDRGTPLFCAREMVMDIPTNARFYMHASANYIPQNRMPLMLFHKGKQIETAASSIVNDYMAIDGNINSYAQLTALVSDFFHFYFEQFELDDTIWIPNGLYFIGDIEVYAATGGNGLIDYNLTRLHGTAWSLGWTNVITGGAGTQMFNTPINRAIGPPPATNLLTDFPIPSTTMTHRYTRELQDNTKMGIRMNASGISSGADLRVYECGVRMDYCIAIRSFNACARMFGRTYGGTWNARKTASATITKPVDTMEGILRHELGAVDADINMNAFDLAHSRRGGTNFTVSYQLAELMESIELFDDFVVQHGLVYGIDPDGKHRVVALGYYTPDHTELKRRDICDPDNTFTVERLDNESVLTGVYVKYDLNRVTGEYGKTSYCDRNGYSGISSGSSFVTLCGTHYAARGNTENIINLEHDYSHYQTVDWLIRFLLNWNQPNRLMISCDVFMDRIALEIGDIITLDDATLTEYVPYSVLKSSRFVVVETRIKRSENRIGIKLLEVKTFI